MDINQSKVIQIVDLINWYAVNELNVTPKYQRNPVWNEIAKSFLIDSIIRDYPIPPLFFREIFDLKLRKTKREVIDGQQRTRAILEFYDNKFPILKKHNSILGGKYFNDLAEEDQEKFLKYPLFVNTISEKDDSIIFDIFARMNTNSINLNKQELRNAKYWGYFKTTIYSISSEVREYFINFETFNNAGLSRMNDLAFVSSLVILYLDGIVTESDSKIESYYKAYDADFAMADDASKAVIEAITLLDEMFSLVEEKLVFFKAKAYMYDLIALYFYQKGYISIPDCKLPDLQDLSKISFALTNISNNITIANQKKADKSFISNEILLYEAAHRVHSNDKEVKLERIKQLAEFLTSI